MNGELVQRPSSAASATRSARSTSSPTSPTRSGLRKVRQLLGYPVVTPYDVFRSYRDQNERVGAKLVEIPVDSFLAKVPEPSASELQALYDKYKDVLPDPARETPGFKIPRQIQLEILSIDGNALAAEISRQADRSRAPSYYENHKSEFEVPSELPSGSLRRPARPDALRSSSRSPRCAASWPRGSPRRKPRPRSSSKFTQIKEDEMIPFADKYLGALDEQEEAKKQGKAPSVVLPTPQDLKPMADREGLDYENSPLLSREEAERLRTDCHRRGRPDPAERRPQVRRRDVRPQDRALSSRSS